MGRVLPILFNTDMVRAILDGRKTVTRRVMKPHNPFRGDYKQRDGLWVNGYGDGSGKEAEGHIKDYSVSSCWIRADRYIEKYAPYHIGDILYVRETWCRVSEDVDKIHFEHSDTMWDGMYLYKAVGYDLTDIGKWHPSIHMPKEAARIWLKVTDVRVERLQDITEEQAKAEGVTYEQAGEAGYERWIPSLYDPDSGGEPWYAGAYAWIWNSTIKKTDLASSGWEANPWVWVIEFERCEKPEN